MIFLFCFHFELFPKSLSHYPKNLPDGKHSVKWEKRYKEMNQRNFYSVSGSVCGRETDVPCKGKVWSGSGCGREEKGVVKPSNPSMTSQAV